MLNSQKEAKKILQKFGVNTRPVDVKNIAIQLGVKVVESYLDDELCGMLYREEDQFIIGVNEKHSKTRQRFTIAHEIGHLVMHSHLIHKIHLDRTFSEKLHRDGRSKTGENKIEREANRFAAELLMPSELLIEDIKEVSIDPEEGPTELAKQYEVSIQAMSIKLMKTLGGKYYSD